MPYKNKCFSSCKSLKARDCLKRKYCRTIKSYNRSGRRTNGHCRLSNKYKLSKGKTRSRKCRMIGK